MFLIHLRSQIPRRIENRNRQRTVASRGMPSTVYAIPISVISTGHFEYERTNEMLKAIRKSAKDVDEYTDASRHGVFIIQSMTEDEKVRDQMSYVRAFHALRATDKVHGHDALVALVVVVVV